MLSQKAKQAIKVGLAMTIAYGIALQSEWMSSTWAAISVAFISLPTAGQSLEKSVLRIGGTLLAFVVGLFYLGMFPQDRWLFLIAFTPYLAFVTYKVTGKQGQYFWFVAGFVTMMIVTAGPVGSEHAFEFAAFRTMETLLGIVVWTLVSVFLWPNTNPGALETISQQLLATQKKIAGGYRDRLLGRGTAATFRSSREEEIKLLGQLGQTIGAAASESYAIKEVRPLWERLHALSVAMMEATDGLVSDIGDLQKIETRKILPGLDGFFSEVNARFDEAMAVLAGQPPSFSCTPIEFTLSDENFHALDHFQRAAIEVTRNRLQALDDLTRELVNCVRDLKGYENDEASAEAATNAASGAGFLRLQPLDPDRVRAAIMVVTSMWAATLIWIYVNPPGHISWYQFVPNVTLVLVQTPQLKFDWKPFVWAYPLALAAYVFVMPQLTDFWQLGLLIFSFTFMASYLFSGTAALAALYLGMFNMFGISNEQSYNFAAQANAYVFTLLALSLVIVLGYIIRSPRQEKAFLSMTRRFFRSCEFFARQAARSEPPGTLLEQMQSAFYRHELRSLPGKLGTWGKCIDRRKFPNHTPEQVANLAAGLQVLAYRVDELIEVSQLQQSDFLVRELRDDVRAWRIVIEQGFQRWSEIPETDPAGDLRNKLSARVAALDARIEEVLNRAGDGVGDGPGYMAVGDQDSSNFYRLLGSYRGLSEAAIAYAGVASGVDWAEWREERF
jgi:hypothetical protein